MGGAAMPWPLIPRRAHRPASWLGRRLAGDSAAAVCSAAMMSARPSATWLSGPGRAADRCRGTCSGKARARNPAAISVSRSSPGLPVAGVTVISCGRAVRGCCEPRSMRVAGSPGVVRRSSQLISCGGFGRRSSTPDHSARPGPEADAEPIAGALVVYRSELVGEPYAGRRPVPLPRLARSPAADRGEPCGRCIKMRSGRL